MPSDNMLIFLNAHSSPSLTQRSRWWRAWIAIIWESWRPRRWSESHPCPSVFLFQCTKCFWFRLGPWRRRRTFDYLYFAVQLLGSLS